MLSTRQYIAAVIAFAHAQLFALKLYFNVVCLRFALVHYRQRHGDVIPLRCAFREYFRLIHAYAHPLLYGQRYGLRNVCGGVFFILVFKLYGYLSIALDIRHCGKVINYFRSIAGRYLGRIAGITPAKRRHKRGRIKRKRTRNVYGGSRGRCVLYKHRKREIIACINGVKIHGIAAHHQLWRGMQRFLRRFIAIHYCHARAQRAVPKHAVLAVYGAELHSLYTICGVRRYFQHILGHSPCPGIKIRQPQPIICCIRSKREFLNVIRYYGLYCYVSKRFSVIYNGKIQANQFSRASRGRAVIFPGNVCRQQRKRAYAACSRHGFSYCFERYVHHRRGIFNGKLACRTFVPICKCSIKIRSRGQVGCVAYRIAERVGNIKRHILRILGYEHRIKLLAHNNMYLIAAALSAVEVYFAVHHVK